MKSESAGYMFIKNARHELLGETGFACYAIERPYVVCVVNLVPQQRLVQGVGIAKCNPTDKWSEKLGRKIALERALAKAHAAVASHLSRGSGKHE